METEQADRKACTLAMQKLTLYPYAYLKSSLPIFYFYFFIFFKKWQSFHNFALLEILFTVLIIALGKRITYPKENLWPLENQIIMKFNTLCAEIWGVHVECSNFQIELHDKWN